MSTLEMAGLVSEAHQMSQRNLSAMTHEGRTAVQPLIAERKEGTREKLPSQRNSAFSYRCPQISQANRILGHPGGWSGPVRRSTLDRPMPRRECLEQTPSLAHGRLRPPVPIWTHD